VRIFKRRPAPAAVPDPQCTATTRAGSRCRLPVVPGTDRCLVHALKPPTTPAAA
jgi:anaerobic selenocysteine-containing dehydrogenase